MSKARDAMVEIAKHQFQIDRIGHDLHSGIGELEDDLQAARARLDASEALCERYHAALVAIERIDDVLTRGIARAALSPGDNAAGS